MPKAKKRLSKAAKAALKAIAESKLLTVKAASVKSEGQEFRSGQVTPRTATANKLRPEKKKG